MKFVKIENKYFGRLEKGEDIIDTLTSFCKKNEINNGWVKAIGAAGKLKLGYYNTGEKKYIFKDFNDNYEITSMEGDITLFDNNPMLHLHINISDSEFRTFGGHIFGGTVTATCEFIIEKLNNNLKRSLDNTTGLNLIDF